MKIAFISDIHGNLEALKSVIKDCKNEKVDKIICLGDIVAKGIHPHKCIEIVKENCDVVLQGNTDHRYSDDPEKFKNDELEYKRLLFNQSLMTKSDLEYLKNLPMCYEFYMSGNLIRCFHGTPQSPFGFVNDYDMDMKKKYSLFMPSENTQSDKIADIAIYGHLHYPYMLTYYNRKAINTGSVGSSACSYYAENLNALPNEITKAHYLILQGNIGETVDNISIIERSVVYSVEKELEANKDKNPEYEDYKNELLYGKYRNVERVKSLIQSLGYQNYDFEI